MLSEHKLCYMKIESVIKNVNICVNFYIVRLKSIYLNVKVIFGFLEEYALFCDYVGIFTFEKIK